MLYTRKQQYLCWAIFDGFVLLPQYSCISIDFTKEETSYLSSWFSVDTWTGRRAVHSSCFHLSQGSLQSFTVWWWCVFVCHHLHHRMISAFVDFHCGVTVCIWILYFLILNMNWLCIIIENSLPLIPVQLLFGRIKVLNALNFTVGFSLSCKLLMNPSL